MRYRARNAVKNSRFFFRGQHEHSFKAESQVRIEKRDRHSGEAVLPDRRSFVSLQAACICSSLLGNRVPAVEAGQEQHWTTHVRSEEHTSELQSLRHLVCR